MDRILKKLFLENIKGPLIYDLNKKKILALVENKFYVPLPYITYRT